MPPTETFIGHIPDAFSFLGDLLFRWVPATVSVVASDVQGTTTPYLNFTQPVSAWDVPGLLAQTSDSATYHALAQGWFIFTVISLAISVPFLALVVYCWLRIIQIRRKERQAVLAAQRTVQSEDIPRTQLRWSRVLDQTNASTPESWRLAILEADIMLNELLDLQGYRGETMADKMKRVDRATFNTIDDAWEAHKIRNLIAHAGAAHEISSREARRVIALYERVFREFKYIE